MSRANILTSIRPVVQTPNNEELPMSIFVLKGSLTEQGDCSVEAGQHDVRMGGNLSIAHVH